MQLRPLGSSGLQVSPICLGTMTFGSPVAEADAIGLTHAALDMGINFVDTANVYEGYARFLGSPGGVAEEIVGKAIHDRRDRVILATKVGASRSRTARPRTHGHPYPARSRSQPAAIANRLYRLIHHSLARQTHSARSHVAGHRHRDATRQDSLFCALNHAAWQLCEFLWLAEKQHGPRVVSSQIPFSMLRREFHHDLAFCRQHNIGVTPYQSLQGGLLTGKYRRGQTPTAGTCAADKPDWIWRADEALFDRLEAIERLADQANLPMAQYALAWTLAQPAMSSLIVGVTRREQIEQAIAAAANHVPAEHLAEVDKVCPPPWQQPDPVRG